ncbi:hypothetical protein PUN28_013874 [Cardiocondyla obscurior]|uniref:Secreted protein n=1 Tax=Cardiocondyla obscurior TaxID=286306 RepID=A0AAW2F7T1_9HYME
MIHSSAWKPCSASASCILMAQRLAPEDGTPSVQREGRVVRALSKLLQICSCYLGRCIFRNAVFQSRFFFFFFVKEKEIRVVSIDKT